jgi:Concanavalin A-like lectin/glucanases superfamily
MGTVLAILAFSLFVFSCQKKFDPKSYAPSESFGGFSSSDAIEPSALVAHFSFENNLVDSVSKTAASNAGTTFSPGIKGQALQIGVNNYAVFPTTGGIAGLQSTTVAYWMNTTEDVNGIQPFVSFVDSNQFWGNLDVFLDQQTASGAVFHIHAFGTSGTQEVFLTSWPLSNWGVWTHVALTYDATVNHFALYLNGSQVGDSTVANFGPLTFTNVPAMVIGTMQFNTVPSLTSATTSQPWCSNVLGEMDELRIYNKPLTAAEVKALYQLENLGQ